MGRSRSAHRGLTCGGLQAPKHRMISAALALFCGVCSPRELAAQGNPVQLDTLQVQVESRVSRGLPVRTRSVQLLRREEIQRLPVRTISGLLAWATGVEIQSRSPAQNDLGIRGSGFEQVVVLVDGVRMSDPQTGHFDLDLAVPLDQVERVEILRGPASALYGADAMGGVVNVVTRSGGEQWQARMEGGSWGTARASAGGSVTGRAGSFLRVGGEFSRSDGHRSGTDFEASLLHLVARRPLGPGNLSATAGLARRDFGARDFYAPYPSFERTRTFTSGLRWRSGDPAGKHVEVGASVRSHRDEFTLVRSDPSIYQNRHTSSQLGVDALFGHRLGEGLDFALGAEVFRDRLRSNSLGDRDEDRGALFGEAVLGGAGAGVLSLGLRQDWHQGFPAVFSPSLSGSLRIGEGLRARLAAGRSFRAPTWTERYYQDPINVGREDLDPERAWSGEVGLDLDGGAGFLLAGTAFIRKAENLIDWARPVEHGEEVPPWETRNVEKATFRGLEIDMSGAGPFQTRWTLGGMVLSVDAEESRGFESKYAFRPLVEQATAGVEKWFGSSLTLGLNLQRARRKGQDPYNRADVRGRVKLGPAWLYLDANNLLDARYPDITGARAPGRAFFLGMEFRSGTPRP